MTSDKALDAASLAVQRAHAFYAPEDRVCPFDVAVSREPTGVRLTGTVATADVRAGLLSEVRSSVRGRVTADLSVLADFARVATVGVPAAPVRGSPDPEAEQVTQALYGAPVTVNDVPGECMAKDRDAADRDNADRNGWRRVRTPDGYHGWVRASAIDPVADRFTPEAGEGVPRPWGDGVLLADVVTDDGTVHAGSDCVLEAVGDDSAVVRFRTGTSATVDVDDVRRLPFEQDVAAARDAVVSTARTFLDAGTPYEWGGMTRDGIDCSGLVWIAYATVGRRLPRDADQQSAMGRAVDRDSLLPGDLCFFPGHVAISLGGSAYVHASGSAESVTVNSFDPADDRYLESLDESMTGARRIIGE